MMRVIQCRSAQMIHLLYLVAQIFLTYKRRLNILHDTKRKFLSTRANRYDISWLKPGTSAETFVYYLNVPMDLMYKKTIAKNTKWMLYGGPRLNFGLFGFTNKHYYLATKPQEKETTPFSSGGTLNSLDYSLGIGTGVEIGHFQFMLGYDLPLSNSSKDPDLSQLRQHNFRFSVAFSFRKQESKTFNLKP